MTDPRPERRPAPVLHSKQTRPLICAFCRADLGQSHASCSGCRALYHVDCRRLLASCASLGCNHRPAQARLRAARAPRRRSTPRRLFARFWYEYSPVVAFFSFWLSAIGLVFAWSLTI